MKKNLTSTLIAAVVLLILLIQSPQESIAQSEDFWSHWSIVDGLVETWSLGISAAPGGEAWVIHGEDGRVSVITGYEINHVQFPRAVQRIEFSPSGGVWAVSPSQLHYLDGNQWLAFDLPLEFYDTTFFKPISDQTVILLFNNKLYRFTRDDSRFIQLKNGHETGLTVFTELARSPNNRFWITGTDGVASFQIQSATVQNWTEFSAAPLDFSNFHSAWVSEENELYAIAQSKTEQKHIAVRFDGEEWKTIYQAYGLGLIQCWKGIGEVDWVLNRNNTLIKVYEDRIDRLTGDPSRFGQILDVAIQQKGIIWIASSKGVFRHAPSVWNTPFELRDIQQSVNSVIEDPAGRLWFDCTSFLLKYEDGEWSRYPYPGYRQSSYYETGTLSLLPNQSIAVRMLNAEDVLFVFDPNREVFQTLENPEGDLFGTVKPVGQDAIWIQLGQNFGDLNAMRYRIASYDGERFNPVLDLGSRWDIGYPRAFLREEDGGFWIGGTAGLARYHQNQYEKIASDDRINDEAAFALMRDAENRIWVGGRNSIRSFDGDHWEILLSNTDQIRSFYPTKDAVWVCTAAGLIRHFNDSWITMTEKERLPSSVVNEILFDSQGEMWAVTSNGIALYQPEYDTFPPVARLDLSVNPNRFAPGTPVYIRMGGLDMWKTTLDNYLYFSYRIDRQEWSPFTSNPIATFTDLPPGKYLFEYRVMDSNFNISPISEHYIFSVLRNWYEEPSVVILFILFICITLFFMFFAIRHQIRLHTVNHQLKKANKELERISYIDGLTGIANRRCFDQHFQTEWRRAMRYKTPLSVMICDVDYFKPYNDHLGHLAGDDCLRLIAKTLASTIQRAGDMVARYGGEEFVILLVNTTQDKARMLADMIQKKIEALHIPHPQSKCHRYVTISSGITTAVPDEHFTEQILLSVADKALYISKQKGRNRSHSIPDPYGETWSNGTGGGE